VNFAHGLAETAQGVVRGGVMLLLECTAGRRLPDRIALKNCVPFATLLSP
jgi:hypothetical protein